MLTNLQTLKFDPAKLKLFRELRGVTQRELAEAIGIKTPTLSSYEIGHRRPTPDVLIRLIAFYGIKDPRILTTSDAA